MSGEIAEASAPGVRALREAQDKRRAALIERLGTIADLTDKMPLEGELGDIAYDLLRQAAAQIASDRKHLSSRVAGIAEGLERIVDLATTKPDEHPASISIRMLPIRQIACTLLATQSPATGRAAG